MDKSPTQEVLERVVKARTLLGRVSYAPPLIGDDPFVEAREALFEAEQFLIRMHSRNVSRRSS